MSFIWFILIGILAGFVAGRLMRGGGFGLIVNLVVGIIGGVLGGWLFGLLGISAGGIIGSLITAVDCGNNQQVEPRITVGRPLIYKTVQGEYPVCRKKRCHKKCGTTVAHINNNP